MTDYAGKKCVVGGDGTATAVDLTPEEVTQRQADQTAANSAATAIANEDTRLATFNSAADVIDTLSRLNTATAAQIDTFVDGAIPGANVTNLRNECRAMFKRVIKTMALISKRR